MSDVLTQAGDVIQQADRRLQQQVDGLANRLAQPPQMTEAEIKGQVLAHIASLSYYLMSLPVDARSDVRQELMAGRLVDEIVADTAERPGERLFAVDVPPAIRRFSDIGLALREAILSVL